MPDPEFIRPISIIRVENNEKYHIEDHVIDEDVFKIYINGDLCFQMIFSKTHAEYLVTGFLYTQGIIVQKTEIEQITIRENACHLQLAPDAARKITEFKTQGMVKGSSGGLLLGENNVSENTLLCDTARISPRQVSTLIKAHWEHSVLFQKTGALHSAALCTANKVNAYFEDIGRHNAVDKLAGYCLCENIQTKEAVATLSCRMSLEIIGKIIKTGIPIVISNAAPTLGAIRLAQKAGLTIIGFARNNRFNIYTHPDRVA